MTEVVTVDLSKNPKQYEYFIEVVKACKGVNRKRKFGYGGAIRGGKTFITLFILTWLCRKYPGSRWVVIRDAFPSLQKTTIESLKKILNHSSNWSWNLDRGNYFVQNDLGSRIYFMAENIAQDPDLTSFLGLEVNGIFFEQLEELSQKVWQIGMSRAGSWYIDPMPPAFIFTTFNPTQRWPKQEIYERHIAGTLPEDWHYQTALPSDNAFVTDDQWNAWGQMADRYQKQFIGGDWTDFDDTDPRWLWTFSEHKHVSPVPLKVVHSIPLHLSFDFNINPITCIAGQHSQSFGPGSFVRLIKEWVIPNSAIGELCKQIKIDFPYNVLTATGDATGRGRNAGYESGDETLWGMVQAKLKLADGQILTPLTNPSHKNSRFLCNNLMQNHPNYLIDPGMKQLLWDCRNAKPKPTKNPDQEDQLDKGPGASETGMNVFDCFRYYNQTHLIDFSKSQQ